MLSIQSLISSSKPPSEGFIVCPFYCHEMGSEQLGDLLTRSHSLEVAAPGNGSRHL